MPKFIFQVNIFPCFLVSFYQVKIQQYFFLNNLLVLTDLYI